MGRTPRAAGLIGDRTADAGQDREERALELAQANKELMRNLAHEIKNPLGGIRGAAQLLEMEAAQGAASAAARAEPARRRRNWRGLTEYTQVIIHEADRLQALVDRCWRRTASRRAWWATSTSTRSASACAADHGSSSRAA